MSDERTLLKLAIGAAGFPEAELDHVCDRLESALLVYREGPRGPPHPRVRELIPWKPAPGRPRDKRLESLLIAIAVEFHVALPAVPGVVKVGKSGEKYRGSLVELTQRVLDIAGIDDTPELGRLIYRAVRKEAQIHGKLELYPPMGRRSRASWSLPSDDEK